MGDVTKNFSKGEFTCRCGCRTNKTSVEFIKWLQEVRDEAQQLAGEEIPFSVVSGTRCPAHNRASGGKPSSGHLYGDAADIKCTNGRHRYFIIKAAINKGCRRFGVDGTFIHLDRVPDLPQDMGWTY